MCACGIAYSGKHMKITTDEKHMLDKGLKRLIQKITAYDAMGIDFEHICNDDSVKYDVLGKGFYTLKVNNQRLPLRVLYRFVRQPKGVTIEVHKVYLKKYNNKKYIQDFSSYVQQYS